MARNNYILPYRYNGLGMDEKSNLWSKWSTSIKNGGTGFPYDMEEIAQQINLETSLDIDESYGYKVLYYMLFEEWDNKTVEEYFKIDDYYRIYGT